MSGAYLRFSFDDGGIEKSLVSAAKRAGNPEPFLKSIGEEMLPRINDRFKSETGPEGDKWASLAPRTIQRRQKKYGNAPLTILRMRGHLAGSINYQVGGHALRIGTDDAVEDYAAIHQFGGEAGRGRKVKIPARPYLGFSDDDYEVIEEEAAVYFSVR